MLLKKQYLVLLTVTYPVLVTKAQKRNSFDERTGNLKLDKKIFDEKLPKPKDTNTSRLGWYGMRRMARSKTETRLNTNTSRMDFSKWERWEGRRRDKKERMEAQKIERCLLQSTNT